MAPEAGFGDRFFGLSRPCSRPRGQRFSPVLRDTDDTLLLGHDHGHVHHVLRALDPLQQDRLAGQRLGLDLCRHRRRAPGAPRPTAPRDWVETTARERAPAETETLFGRSGPCRGPAIIAWPPPRGRLRAPGFGQRNRHDRRETRRHHRREGAESRGRGRRGGARRRGLLRGEGGCTSGRVVEGGGGGGGGELTKGGGALAAQCACAARPLGPLPPHSPFP